MQCVPDYFQMHVPNFPFGNQLSISDSDLYKVYMGYTVNIDTRVIAKDFFQPTIF